MATPRQPEVTLSPEAEISPLEQLRVRLAALKDHGWPDVTEMHYGFDAWQARRYPVERSGIWAASRIEEQHIITAGSQG